jgi:hypothetical protein
MRYLRRMSISQNRAQLASAACIFAGLVSSGACGGPAPGGATIANTTATAPGAEPSVRSVDWLNRTYGSVTVVDGEHEYALDEDGNQVAPDYQPKDPDGWVERGSFRVAPPVYGDVTGDGAEEAIIISTENSGGTGQFDGIEVYAMRGGQPVVIGGIPGGDRGDGGISDIAIEGNIVVVQRMASQEGDGACCPSKLQTERWTWNGSTFIEDEAARKLEDFGE